MLTAQLQKDIDDKWEACWPVYSLRPLVLLDLLSYLLFIKKIAESNLIIETRTQKNEVSWHALINMDAQNLQKLFTDENGITELLKNYGSTNLKYSQFVRKPLMATPTIKLLENMMAIIQIMDIREKKLQPAIFEYLLHKTDHNGQAYTPNYIVRLIVAILKPAPSDILWDPSVGDGSLLVNSTRFVVTNNPASLPGYGEYLDEEKYHGSETDGVFLRIAAMNMILNGINNPKLNLIESGEDALNFSPLPSLILSNLFVESIEHKNTANAIPERQDVSRLSLILKNMNSNCRAAIIMRENILSNNNAEEIKTLRKQIINEHNLTAIISVQDKNDLFYGACILIFSESNKGITNGVWFHKSKTQANERNIPGLENVDALEIINCWKNKTELPATSADCFQIPVDVIAKNQYNLSYNQYKTISYQTGSADKTHKNINHQTTVKPINTIAKSKLFEKELHRPVNPKFTKKTLRTIILLMLFAIIITVIYSWLFKNKHNTSAVLSKRDTILTPDINNGKQNDTFHKKKSSSITLSDDQIKKILKDTSGIIQFNEKIPTVVTEDSDNINVAPNNLHIKYIVIDTAFFHNEPDEKTARKSFLDPLNKNILTPLDDKNGFILIVYTNHFGRTSNGWINKGKLRSLP